MAFLLRCFLIASRLKISREIFPNCPIRSHPTLSPRIKKYATFLFSKTIHFSSCALLSAVFPIWLPLKPGFSVALVKALFSVILREIEREIMARKRVHALYPLIRAPDGSAFSKCELCGVSVPIALADMHDCEEFNVKRIRKFDKWCGIQEEPDEKRLLTIAKEPMIPPDFRDQPRSPFCFFMEEFSQNFEGHFLIEVSQRGFETWKNMSFEERTRYSVLASKINVPYENKIRQEEIDVMGKGIDDEASSFSTNIHLCQHDEDLSESGSYSSYC